MSGPSVNKRAIVSADQMISDFKSASEYVYPSRDPAFLPNKLKRVEAGAQGHHKLQRGYLHTLTHSTHLISNFSFRSAVGDFLKQEARQVLFEQQELAKMSPFKD